MVPQGRGKCPITRITWMQTSLEYDRTPMQNELHIGHDSRTIHRKHLCKNVSSQKEGNKGRFKWLSGHSEQNLCVWSGLEIGNMPLEEKGLSLSIQVLHDCVSKEFCSKWYVILQDIFSQTLSFAMLINRACHTAIHTHAHTHAQTHTRFIRKNCWSILEHPKTVVSRFRFEPHV